MTFSCSRVSLFVAIVCAFVAAARPTSAQHFVAPLVGELVDHPINLPGERSPSLWNRSAGAWGESFSGETLRLRGFQEIREFKNPSGNGIDRVAIKRGPNGQIMDVRLVEVKTTRGEGKPRLGETLDGRQMSRNWLAKKLRAMRASPDPETRALGREISRFRKQARIPIEALGELHEINPRTSRYTVRNPITGAALSTQSIDSLLRSIERRGPKHKRAWSARTREDLPRLRGMSRADWLRTDPMQQMANAKARATHTLQGANAAIRRRLLRAAGPIGAGFSLVLDARELHSHRTAYLEGRISHEQYARFVAQSGGGIAGAWGGAAAGAWIGIKIGAFGGPFAWLTVPAGGILGGVIGGVSGSFLGSAGGSAAADHWYKRLDANVGKNLDLWILSTSFGGR